MQKSRRLAVISCEFLFPSRIATSFRCVLPSVLAILFLSSPEGRSDDGIWTGGPGSTWDSSVTNWSGVTGTPWDPINGPLNRSIFDTPGATATVSGTVTTNSIVFQNTAILSGGTITLAGVSPILEVNADATIQSVLDGIAGFTKTGSALLSLSADNSITGDLILEGGTLAYLADQTTSVGAIVFGAAAGSTISSTLDLSSTPSNLTASGLSVQTDSATANLITIGSGKTLTLTGSTSANVLSVGGFNLPGAVSKLTILGGGTLDVIDATRNVVVANADDGSTAGASAQMDLSGLNSFNATIANLYVGRATASNGGATIGRPTSDLLTLAGTNNITASGVIAVGGTSKSFGTHLATLNLGTTNILNASSFVVGSSRTAGRMVFDSGLTNPTATLRGAAGGTSRTNIFLGDQANTTGTSNSSGGSSVTLGTMDFTAGSLDAQIDQLFVGYGALDAGANGFGQGNGAFSFGGAASVVDINSLVIGQNRSSSTLAVLANPSSSPKTTSTGTFTMNDGTLTVNSQLIVANDLDDLTGTTIQNANGTLTLAGGTTTIGSPGTPVDVILGNHASTGAGTSTAVMNLTGGSVTVNGDIKQGESGAGTIVSTLTLNGSTLDLTGHQIGADGALIGTINLLSGTLLNVTEINAGGDISKTGSGTLNLGGTNTYTGGTTIGGGTLVFGPS